MTVSHTWYDATADTEVIHRSSQKVGRYPFPKGHADLAGFSFFLLLIMVLSSVGVIHRLVTTSQMTYAPGEML